MIQFRNLNYINVFSVHRDLKPQNILFAESKGITLVKISDFGISKDMSGNRSSSMSCLAGTETWLAPETETVQRAVSLQYIESFSL